MSRTDARLHEEHPELGLLLTHGSDLIAAALDQAMRLESEARPVQVRFSPGRSVLVQYLVACESDRGTTTETFVASIGRSVPPETAVVSAGNVSVAVWRVPHDPFLPGLAMVENRETVGRMLGQIGVEADLVSLRRRSYRPGRRAVIEISTGGDRVFAKVVRPSKVAVLQRLHTSLASLAPIPQSLGWSEQSGIAILQSLPGHPLRHAIEVDSEGLPAAVSILGLLRDIGVLQLETAARPRLVDRVDEHARFLGIVEPAIASRVDSIAASISQHERSEPRKIIHGDLHASQIMVGDHGISGLIDIDTVGSGEPTDDLANLVAHIATLTIAVPESASRMSAYGAELMRGFDTVTDPRQLRLRIAASLLGYATGPFRVQERDWRHATALRIEMTEQWLDAALAAT